MGAVASPIGTTSPSAGVPAKSGFPPSRLFAALAVRRGWGLYRPALLSRAQAEEPSAGRSPGGHSSGTEGRGTSTGTSRKGYSGRTAVFASSIAHSICRRSRATNSCTTSLPAAARGRGARGGAGLVLGVLFTERAGASTTPLAWTIVQTHCHQYVTSIGQTVS